MSISTLNNFFDLLPTGLAALRFSLIWRLMTINQLLITFLTAFFNRIFSKEMATISLLNDCRNTLLKGHKSWKLYFSKWEILAKQEEEISENELVDDLEKNVKYLTKKKKKLHKKNPSSVSSLTIKKTLKEKRNMRRLIKEKKKILPVKKIQKEQKIIEQPMLVDNENFPEELDIGQLELDLRTIFIDILKSNQNKWEMFSVLSQMFSHGQMTIEDSNRTNFNQHKAITSNDIKVKDVELSFENQLFSSSEPQKLFFNPTSFNFQKFYCNPVESFGCHIGVFNECENNMRQTTDFMKTQFDDKKFAIDRVNFCFNNIQKSALVPFNSFQTPQQTSKTKFKIGNKLLKSCPRNMFFSQHLNDFSYQKNIMLKSLTLDLGNKYIPKDYSKIYNEHLGCNSYEQQNSPHPFEAHVCREKSFQNLCLHKRTNDVSLNMENSNFMTPKRKPSKRKCFSENIKQRKRRRPSNLEFFDKEENESESEDDQAEYHSPLIRWECKNKKNVISQEKIITDSDSDESDTILDRIYK